MSTKFTIILVILIITAFTILTNQIRRKKLQLQYSLNWMMLLLIILILVIFPQIINWFSIITGIGVPVNLVFFLGFCFVLILVYSLTLSVSKLSAENKELAQKIALLSKKISEDEKNENRN